MTNPYEKKLEPVENTDGQKPEKVAEVSWKSRAETFMEKIEKAREEYLRFNPDDGGPFLQSLNNLEGAIADAFHGYERKKYTLKQVEEDLEYRIKNTPEADRRELYEQILAMVKIMHGPIF